MLELLVVLAITGIMLGLMLTALQSGRESARRMSCGNNLKQIGIALHNYQTAYRRFPPSFCTTSAENASGTGDSWSIHGRLLPFLEEGHAQNLVDLAVDWHDQVNTGIPFLRISTYMCPSEPNDSYRWKDGAPYVGPHTYGFNLGAWLIYDPVTGRGGDGAFIVDRGVRLAEFTDGLARTLAVAEVKAYQPYIRNTSDPGSNIPESVVFAASHTGELKLGPAVSQNTGHTVWPDGRAHHSGITTTFAPNTFVPYYAGQTTYDVDFTSQQEGRSAIRATYAAITSRSHHIGIVNVLMADGSVRSLKDNIARQTWRAMGSRGGNGSGPMLLSLPD